MAQNYTKEDKAAFARKDLLNARMSAVKAASVMYEGKSPSFGEYRAYTDAIFDWIFQDQLNEFRAKKSPEEKKESNDAIVESDEVVIPTPGAVEQSILETIHNKDVITETWDDLCKLVLEWSVTNKGVTKPVYPRKEASIQAFINWYILRNRKG